MFSQVCAAIVKGNIDVTFKRDVIFVTVVLGDVIVSFTYTVQLGTPYRKKSVMLFKKWYFLSVMAFLCIFVLPPAAVTAQETSQVRFAHFVFNGPQVNIFVDDQVFKGEDGQPYVLNALDISRQYIELTVGEPHSFVVAEAGKTVKDALFEAEAFTLEADHKYALAIMGNVEAKDLHYTLFDETAAIKAKDPTVSAVDFVFNNLYGLPSVDFYWGG